LEAALEDFPPASAKQQGKHGTPSGCSQRNAEAVNSITSSGFLIEVVQQAGGVVL